MRKLGYLAAAFMVLWPYSAEAGLGERELQVAGRLLGFIGGIDQPELTTAIVYSGDLAASQDARQLEQLLSGGFEAGEYTLMPRMVSVDELHRLDGADLVLLADNVSGHHSAVFEATRSRNLLSISSESACVDQGLCVMAIQAEPVVEVLVSTSAAEQSQITLAQALRMMVKER